MGPIARLEVVIVHPDASAWSGVVAAGERWGLKISVVDGLDPTADPHRDFAAVLLALRNRRPARSVQRMAVELRARSLACGLCVVLDGDAPQDRPALVAAGADAVLVRPFESRDLALALHDALCSAGLRRRAAGISNTEVRPCALAAAARVLYLDDLQRRRLAPRDIEAFVRMGVQGSDEKATRTTMDISRFTLRSHVRRSLRATGLRRCSEAMRYHLQLLGVCLDQLLPPLRKARIAQEG